MQWEFINLSSNYLILLIFKTVLEGQPWHLGILIKYLVVLQRFSAPVTVLYQIYTPSKFQEGKHCLNLGFNVPSAVCTKSYQFLNVAKILNKSEMKFQNIQIQNKLERSFHVLGFIFRKVYVQVNSSKALLKRSRTWFKVIHFPALEKFSQH